MKRKRKTVSGLEAMGDPGRERPASVVPHDPSFTPEDTEGTEKTKRKGGAREPLFGREVGVAEGERNAFLASD